MRYLATKSHTVILASGVMARSNRVAVGPLFFTTALHFGLLTIGDEIKAEIITV